MKIKKIILIIFLMVIGIKGVSAYESTQPECTASQYENLKSAYRDLAVLSYYHTLADKSMTDAEKAAILNNDSPVKSIMDANGKDANYYINDLYNIYKTAGVYNTGNSGLAYQLLNQKYGLTCKEVDTIYNKTASNVNNTIDYLWGEVAFVTEKVAGLKDSSNNDHKEDFKTLEASTSISFEGLCDYLASHKGISKFIETALNIVTYAALALGVILGVLDFIQAIASHDDAALNKAAQKFFKRVVAIVLIFLSSFIVSMIVNIVSINGVDRSNIICDEFDLGVKI